MTRLVLCLLYILRIIRSDDFKVKVDNTIFNNQIELTPNDVIEFPERILTYSVPVELVHHHIHRRSSSINYDISLKFHVSSKPVILKLQENTQFKTRIPTYIICENGSIVEDIQSNDLQNTHYYYDTLNGASFYIQLNGSQKIHMYGTFHLEKEEYILEFKNNISNVIHKESQQARNVYNFKVWKTPTTKRRQLDEVYSDLHQSVSRHRRKKRSPAYHVELLFVVDYSIYKHWFDKSIGTTRGQKDAAAKFSIKQFYAFVINGMDGRYLSISPNFMSVVFAGIVISESQSSSLWTESIVSNKHVNAHNALTKFSEWVKKKTDLPSNDHVMLLTRYNLASSKSSSLEGYAFVGAVCSADSQSIMEESDDYVMVTVAAHELGHSLGAQHDGDNNACKKDDFYIMAPSSSPALGSVKPWRFSSCSINYFQTAIQRLDSQNRNCLRSFGPTYDGNALKPYSGKLPGELFSVDEQCARVHGQGSTMCREHYNGDFTTMCGLMWCREPGKGSCRSMVPGDGTLCGNKKWCINGLCTSSNSAASVPDNCAHGNYIGSMDQRGRTCEQIVSLDITECYRERIGLSCCGSCAKVSSGIPGCFYGDRIPSALCNKTACPYYSQEELTQCCKSCSAYFSVPGSNTVPTESDGTNEVLIGVSVAIVIIAVICGVYIHRKRRPLGGGRRTPLASRGGKESRPKPARSAPRIPPTSITNGDANMKSRNNLISNPILNSHTNSNLRTDFQKPDSSNKTYLDKYKGNIEANKHDSNSKSKSGIRNTGSKLDNGKAISSNGTTAAIKPIFDKDNRQITAKTNPKQTQSSFGKAGALLPKGKPNSTTAESEATTSIKDRIAALKTTSDKPTVSSSEPHNQTASGKFKATPLKPVPLASKKPEFNPKPSQAKKTDLDIHQPVNKFDKKPLQPPGKTLDSGSKNPVNKFDKKPLQPPGKTLDSGSKNPVNKFDKKPLQPSGKTLDSGSKNPVNKFDEKPLRPPGKTLDSGSRNPVNKFEKQALRPPGKSETSTSAPVPSTHNKQARFTQNV